MSQQKSDFPTVSLVLFPSDLLEMLSIFMTSSSWFDRHYQELKYASSSSIYVFGQMLPLSFKFMPTVYGLVSLLLNSSCPFTLVPSMSSISWTQHCFGYKNLATSFLRIFCSLFKLLSTSHLSFLFAVLSRSEDKLCIVLKHAILTCFQALRQASFLALYLPIINLTHSLFTLKSHGSGREIQFMLIL